MSFSFVTYDGPKVPQDPSVRRLIRRQAMKDTAEKRILKRGYGQHNLIQYPAVLGGSNCTEDLSNPGKSLPQSVTSSPRRDRVSSDPDWLAKTKTEQLQNQHAVVSCHHASTLSIPRLHPDFIVAERFSLLLHLTPLTGLRLGIAQFTHPKSEPGRSENSIFTPHLGSRKLLSFIPSRYGHVSSLSHATDCVVAKLQQMMYPPDSRPAAEGEATALLHYIKALRALQAALGDDTQRTTAETLCATELLGVFELLNGTPEARSWMRHAGGAAQLIQARGAHRFQTEFELALFTAHIGPTVMDAFLNNKSCFLGEECWKQVMRSAISSDESFAEQQDLVFDLWSHLVDGPMVFKEVTDLIISPTSPPQGVIDGQIQKILRDRDGLLCWANVAQSRPGSLSRELEKRQHNTFYAWPVFQSGPRSSHHITQLALWGTYALCHIMKARLLVALSPSRFHSLETECQDLACRIIGLRQASTSGESERLLDHLFVSQTIWIAKGIVQTKDIWCDKPEAGNAMIEKWKFEAWCKAIGRTPDRYE